MSDARLVGTWTTELEDDGKSVFGLASFTGDGGVTCYQVNAKNIGLGNWESTGKDSFHYNFHILAVNPQGEHVGEAHVFVAGEFVSDDRWEGTGGANFYSPAGDLLRGHEGSRVTARKFGIDK
ncbi:hypothetical protein ACFV6M_05520 [Streptomyces californicus]|uniref:hypothetical protein n=1 Tax=Streptomyces TaxID=1883 RepID=UPI00088C79A9|nr:hypothetical protein [Streptomyces sp. LaPpAH-199]MYW82200.1 hypothetical protein [Streptomyces sp. SID8369]NEA11217.1 hypothetical protein [Streptomyces sp. SID10692]SDC30605.1 hypothetical protein F610DRAFT_01560 [Streptomyces sp. LaPpAH-199]